MLSGALSANAADGCLVLLCLAAPNWSSIPQCVPPIRSVLDDLAHGRPFPTCDMSGAGNSAGNQGASAPGFCPAQYTTAFDLEVGTRYECRFEWRDLDHDRRCPLDADLVGLVRRDRHGIHTGGEGGARVVRYAFRRRLRRMARDTASRSAHVSRLLSHTMDALTFAALVATCAPLVHPATAHALVDVESRFNPYAIGVVSGALERQPRNAGEAVATAHALKARSRNFSLGLAQINVGNLDRLGLTIPEAFDACRNLGAMQTILSECFERAAADLPPQQRLRRALSCYYSGNFSTGFGDGYVARVVTAARRTGAAVRGPP